MFSHPFDIPDDVGEDGVVEIRWRDNGGRSWSPPVQVVLGNRGASGLKETIRRLGAYITRQYEFVSSSACPISIVAVEEEVDIIRG